MLILLGMLEKIIASVVIIIILLILIYMYFMWSSSVYKRFMRMDTKCDEAEFSLDDWLNKKYELLAKLSGNEALENPSLMPSANDKYLKNIKLDELIDKLDLKMHFEHINENINIFKNLYNQHVKSYNRFISIYPNKLLAIKQFEKKVFFGKD